MPSIMDALRLWIRTAPAPEDHRGPAELPQPISIDADGWLVGPGVIRMPSARGGASKAMAGGAPVCVVRHATATPWGTGAAIARSWRAAVESHSAHMTIDVVTEISRAAEVKRWRKLGWHTEAAQLASADVDAALVYQHRSLLTTAWHAYGSTDGVRTSGTIDGQHLNAISIGIEATCVGKVRQDKAGRWRGWSSAGGVGTGAIVPADQVSERGWHTYHSAVLDLERQVDAALLARFPSLGGGPVTVTPSPFSAAKGYAAQRIQPMMVGHCDVDPTRKTDPYPTGGGRGLG